MTVLWITNILFPEALTKLIGNSELKSSGGWMLGAAEYLATKDSLKLYVASVSPLVEDLQRIEGERIVYYILPYGKGNLKLNPQYQDYWKKIKVDISPDVVHIHGTEFSHGYEYMRACGSNNVVISIQGMKSAIFPFYHYGIPKSEIIRNTTFRDIIKGNALREKRNYRLSSAYEVAMLKMTNHIIGRTSWDRAKTWAINPQVRYHFCNETLRAEFYDGSMWNYNECCKHTIFISQAEYPIKGLHQVLKAMPLILRHYPNATLRIAGNDITKNITFRNFLRFTGYGKYIKRLITHLNLRDKVKFLGNLNAEDMKREYLSCNVFVCPSSIENSPNSLGEAQILGVPCVASYVGGVPDMMVENEENLYRFEDIEMLAYKVCQVFAKQKKINDIVMKRAFDRHDPSFNDTALLNIYKKVINE